MSLRERVNDFEHWIASAMGLQEHQYMTWDVRHCEVLPDPGTAGAVVITGSHDMVTRKHCWSEKLIEWITAAVETSVPILGICYGHHLLARAIGGEVGDNPLGKEFGTVSVQLTSESKKDIVFRDLGEKIWVHVAHTQSVLSLPSSASILARNDHDQFHAFRYGNNAWGVQFHPEFNAFITRYYLDKFKQSLEAEGKSYDQLLRSVSEQPVGSVILKRFLEYGVE